ncbi:hypothetical protein TrLO_g7184, partial [Triparma laevis f. longispina]
GGGTTGKNNPYPVVRLDIGVDGGRGKKETFVLFEHEDADEVVKDFCARLGAGAGCEESLDAVVLEKREEFEAKVDEEKRERWRCEERFEGGEGGVDTVKLAGKYIKLQGGGVEEMGRVHKEIEGILFPSMQELGELVGTDKVTHHGYHRFYERWLGGYRREQISLLEIGLARGSSMNMWCSYFPAAKIYGIDITLHPGCQPCELGAGISVFSGDSGDEGFLGGLRERLALAGGVEVIV